MVGDKVARVKCNTCEKEHKYRPPDSPSEATAAKRRAERKKAQAEASRPLGAEDYDKLSRQIDMTQSTKYSMKMNLDVNQVVEHPKFGLGIVVELREGSKASIVFPDGGRVLVYGRA
jgi:hypothetical protein